MGLIGNIKQMMQMRAETKRIQDRVNSIEETYENAGVGVRIRGDMRTARRRASKRSSSILSTAQSPASRKRCRRKCAR